MRVYRKEVYVKVMKIVQYLQAAFSWIKEKTQAAWSHLQEQAPEFRDKSMVKVIGFLTSPLSETEYALLKRVSGIVGTAVAVYLTLSAGLSTALVVLGICLILSIGLYRVSGPGHCLVQGLPSGTIMA
jgi:hypothetical protein